MQRICRQVDALRFGQQKYSNTRKPQATIIWSSLMSVGWANWSNLYFQTLSSQTSGELWEGQRKMGQHQANHLILHSLVALLAVATPLSWKLAVLSGINTWLGFVSNHRGCWVEMAKDKHAIGLAVERTG